jgi:hypothetical protein
VGGEKVVVRAPSDDMDMLAVCDTFLGAWQRIVSALTRI